MAGDTFASELSTVYLITMNMYTGMVDYPVSALFTRRCSVLCARKLNRHENFAAFRDTARTTGCRPRLTVQKVILMSLVWEHRCEHATVDGLEFLCKLIDQYVKHMTTNMSISRGNE